MSRPRYVTPWWSHALSAVALLLIAGLIFAPRALENLNANGAIGWYAAGAFVALFLGVTRAVLAFKAWRTRQTSTRASSDG